MFSRSIPRVPTGQDRVEHMSLGEAISRETEIAVPSPRISLTGPDSTRLL